MIRDFVAAGLVRPATVEKPPSPAVQVENLQQRLEGNLHSLVGATGVTPQITSVGKATDGSVVINALARAPQLTSAAMWKVAAAGLANEISAPVRINVTVAATGAGLDIPYHGVSVRPSTAELRRVRRFTAAVPKDASVAFKASTEVDATLVARRIAQLRKLVSRETIDAQFGSPAAANSISVVPVLTISAESLHAGGQ